MNQVSESKQRGQQREGQEVEWDRTGIRERERKREREMCSYICI